MKEIVINSQYGGFGLSNLASAELLKLKNIPCKYMNIFPWKEITEEEALKKRDVEIVAVPKDKNFSIYDIPRDDKDLIATVKKFQSAADGFCSTLKIIEIPDDVEWVIEEHDGLEWVAEKHRVWR